MQVSFLDIKAQYPLIEDDIRQKFDEIIASGHFVGSRGSTYLEEFEAQFAKYCQTKHAIAVSSGTSALWAILYAHNIGPGDEVILPVNTFIATAEAVTLVGATPVFVDVDETNGMISSATIEPKITSKVRAILPVHLYGHCVEMESILQLARSHDLLVVEDACQAHGASYKGRKAGSFGKAAAFSFYAGKNLGAWGEGGAITTNDDKLAEKLRLIRDHGSRQKYHHQLAGANLRLDEFQSAVLTTKLPHLEAWNERRRQHARRYQELLKDAPHLVVPASDADCTSVWHLFVVRHKNRENCIKYLNDHGIQTGIHYPTPLHLTEAYQSLEYCQGDFPVAEKMQAGIISLPMYAELSESHIDYVCQQLRAYLDQESLVSA